MRKRVCWLLAVMMVLALCSAAFAEVGALTVSAKRTLRAWRGEDAGFEPDRGMSVTVAAADIQNALITTMPVAANIGNQDIASQLVFDWELVNGAGALTFNFSGDNITLAAVYQKDDKDFWTQLETSGNSLISRNPLTFLGSALPHDGSYRLAFKTGNSYFVVELKIEGIFLPTSSKGAIVASNFTLSVNTNETRSPTGRPCALYDGGSDLSIDEIFKIIDYNLSKNDGNGR